MYIVTRKTKCGEDKYFFNQQPLNKLDSKESHPVKVKMSHRTDPSDLIRLQDNVDNIRNFCILAHVDHGKVKNSVDL